MSSPDTTLTNSQARGTGNKGLAPAVYPAEKIQYIYDKKGAMIGVACAHFDELHASVIALNQPETKELYKKELYMQYRLLTLRLLTYHNTGTPCLLKAARSLHQLLLLVMTLPDESLVPSTTDWLLDIYREVEKRTQAPYQYKITLNDKELFRPLPGTILEEYPLNQCVLWKQVKQKKWKPALPPIKRKPFTEDGLIPVIQKEPKPVNAQDMENAIAAAEANIKINAVLARIPANDTPVVTLYRENLKMLTLDDVQKQTNFRPRSGDYKLSELVEVIYYVSAHTLVLDKAGEPYDRDGILGHFPYGMILPARKFETIKFAPPPGRYVSLGAFVGQQFEINGGIIKKLSIHYSGILGYTEKAVTGSWAADYQVKANEAMGKNGIYQGSVVVMSAFGARDVGLLDIAGALPDVVEYTIPFFLKVMEKKIREWYENAGDILKEIAQEALRDLVIATLKRVAIEYIVKKIGKKVIPVVNVVAAVGDAVDAIGGDDIEVDTIAINCVRLHLQAINQDDKTYSSKILANIMGDAFEDELKSAISNHLSIKGIKAVAKVKGKAVKPVLKPVDRPKHVAEPKQEAPTDPKTQADPKTQSTTLTTKPGTTTSVYTANKNPTVDAKKTEQQQNQEKERGVDKKENTRPENTTADEKKKAERLALIKERAEALKKKNQGEDNTTTDEKKKAERLALIKKRVEAQKKKAKVGRGKPSKKSRGTKNKKTNKKHVDFTDPDQLKKALDKMEKEGKKSRMNAVRKMSRKEAINDAEKSLNEDAFPNDRARYLANRLRRKYGESGVDNFKKHKKLPHEYENSHLFSASEYPEFAQHGDKTVITDHDDHIANHHGGNTYEPLHGSPKKPSEDDEDGWGDDGDDDGDE